MAQQFVAYRVESGHGDIKRRYTMADVHLRHSDVFVSVTEVHPHTTDGFMGDARFTVHNVSVGEGYVDVWTEINWQHDLTFKLTFLVINP